MQSNSYYRHYGTFRLQYTDQVQLTVSRLHWWGKQYGKFVYMVTTLANRVKSHLAPSA
jgi:hypothetical protein